MAKTKAQLHEESVAAGAVAPDSDPDEFTVDELTSRLGGNLTVEHPVHSEPIVAPDGHVVLSQEDIDARG
jgi:hypothetical protein